MLMWAFIAIAVLCGSAAGVIYLVNRLTKFGIYEKLSKGKRWLKYTLSAVTIVIISVVLTLLWGYINAIICVLHLVIFWLIFDLVRFIIQKAKKKDIKKSLSGYLAIPVTVIYLAVGWYLCNNVWVKDYTIETDKKVGNIKVVQISDSHIGTTFDGKGFQKYADEILEINPDVVLITGDFVDDGTSKEDMILSCQAMGSIKTKYGVYFSFGNHDKGYYGSEQRGYSGDDLIAELEKNNVTVLQDENVLIDDRFYIIGRQDRSEEVEKNESRASMEELMAGLDSSKYTIIMDHQPCDYENQAAAKADLVLSGHTHGGQLIPINFMGRLISDNCRNYGYEKRDDTNFIVTSGISDWEIKFKTGCKSEYVVIDIEGK